MVKTVRSSRWRRTTAAAALAMATALVIAGCSGSGGDDQSGGASGAPQSGGSLTVLLDSGYAGAWQEGIDVATNNQGGANFPLYSAVYGGLFNLAPADGGTGQIVANQAAGYEWSDDGLTLTVDLRDGITFTDGTPLNAEAVVWNWVRALNTGCACAPTVALDLTHPSTASAELRTSLVDALGSKADPSLLDKQLGAITVVDDDTVQVKLAAPNAALINGMPVDSWNWIASPTAFAKMGETDFASAPVAAGPFVVKSNSFSQQLSLERNPTYFKSGLPYLDALTFVSVGGDQVATTTMQSGQGDVYEGMQSVSLIEQAQNDPSLHVEVAPPTAPYVVLLNTRAAPFDDKRAREAIYYATDFDAINKGLFKGTAEVSQSFTGSGGLFSMPTVEGYRTFDLDKAKELVKEVGGISVTLSTGDMPLSRATVTALQTQWQAAGMTVTIDVKTFDGITQQYIDGQWNADLEATGSWDPATGVGVGVFFNSQGLYTGVPLPAGATSGSDAAAKGLTTPFDDLLAKAAGSLDETTRADLYKQAAETISDEAWGPFGVAFSPAMVMKKTVHGPGLDQAIPAMLINPGVLYDQVWVEH